MSHHQYFYHTPFKCYSKTFEHSNIVYARNANEAAEKFVQNLYSVISEKFCEADVNVKQANDDYAELQSYKVRVDMEPSFRATKTGGQGMLR
jgi:hypothetical protein